MDKEEEEARSGTNRIKTQKKAGHRTEGVNAPEKVLTEPKLVEGWNDLKIGTGLEDELIICFDEATPEMKQP